MREVLICLILFVGSLVFILIVFKIIFINLRVVYGFFVLLSVMGIFRFLKVRSMLDRFCWYGRWRGGVSVVGLMIKKLLRI